jgi:hypothetical protein
MVETTEAVWADYEHAVDGVASPVDALRRTASIYAHRHATNPREALIVNRDVSSLDVPAQMEVLAARRRHERAIRSIIDRGIGEGSFDVPSSALASFGILELCVSVARWFSPDGPLTAAEVAERYGEFALRIAGARR